MSGETFFKDGTEWTSEIIEHGIQTGHEDHFVWADNSRDQTFAIHCVVCEHRFAIKAETLYADRTTRGRLLYEGVRTMNGKDTLLETIRRSVKNSKPSPTAWARLLLDDDESV